MLGTPGGEIKIFSLKYFIQYVGKMNKHKKKQVYGKTQMDGHEDLF